MLEQPDAFEAFAALSFVATSQHKLRRHQHTIIVCWLDLIADGKEDNVQTAVAQLCRVSKWAVHRAVHRFQGIARRTREFCTRLAARGIR